MNLSSPEAVFNEVILAANAQQEPGFGDWLKAAVNAVAELPEGRLEMRQRVADAIPSIETPAGAGALAVWLGAGVENGVQPESTTTVVMMTMLRWLAEVNDTDEPADSNAALIGGLDMMGQSLVAHLSRDEAGRQKYANDSALVERFERVSHIVNGAMWVLELLQKSSGEIVVLHGVEDCGWVVEYRNISNCFHLFTLLQGALADKAPGAQTPNEHTIACATGELLEQANDSSWWHYGQPVAGEPELGSSIWGEATPRSIGEIEGQQVMFIWPPILQSRGWGSGFFQPFLQAAPPAVVLNRELSLAEVAAWRSKISA